MFTVADSFMLFLPLCLFLSIFLPFLFSFFVSFLSLPFIMCHTSKMLQAFVLVIVRMHCHGDVEMRAPSALNYQCLKPASYLSFLYISVGSDCNSVQTNGCRSFEHNLNVSVLTHSKQNGLALRLQEEILRAFLIVTG